MAGPPASSGDLVLGRYRLQRVLGRGATSTVWLGHDERLDRPVAVKALDERLLADPTAVPRLEREARAVARLGHPNVVGVHDVAVGPHRAALVLEYVPGRSLLDRVREGPLPRADALRLGAEVASGLAAAHDLGIVHRDVKPANVLLGDDGRARLADFGIATALGEAAGPDEDGLVGTLRYMAPERLEGAQTTGAADVWSLGVVVFEMLTGRSPFAGATPAELLDGTRRGHPLDDLSPDVVPPAAAAAIARALEPDPGARPTAAELGDALRSAINDVVLAPIPAGGSEPSAADGEAAVSDASGDAAIGEGAIGEGAIGDLPTQTDLVRLPARPPAPRRVKVSPGAAIVAGLAAMALLAVSLGWLADGAATPSVAPSAAASSPQPAATSSPTARPASSPPVVAAPAPVARPGHGGGHGKGKGKGG